MPRMNEGGTSYFRNSFQELAAQVSGAKSKALMKAVLVLEKQLKHELSKQGHGRWYGKHRASAPGEPPAVNFGDYRRSFGHELIGGAWRVGTGMKRASALEFGHVYPDGRVLEPRPHFGPALRKAKRGMNSAVVSGLIIRGHGSD